LRELLSRHGFVGARVYRSTAMGDDIEDDSFYLQVDAPEDTILSKLIQLERAATELLWFQTVLNTPSLLLEEFRGRRWVWRIRCKFLVFSLSCFLSA
jgi:hypothetical protein